MRIPGLPLNNIFLDAGLRLIVGAVFIIAGIAKLPLHPEWVANIAADKILPSSLVQPFLSALPWLEIIIGACLILGLFTRLFSVISLPLIAGFIVGNAVALSSDSSDWCRCFGELIKINHKWALLIDALLIIGALLILFQRRRLIALDSWITRFAGCNRLRFL